MTRLAPHPAPRSLIAALLLTLAPAGPVTADANIGGKIVDCYCTDTSGSRKELGEVICLQVDGRMFTAQCQMSLNVPMWRELQNGCLSSGLAPRDARRPLGQSAPVAALSGR
ncbi:hypothetical protein [Pseudooceanicola aestuarii]|uniref:hypothetical protein n=1 Tax=Pseudooceanicola aestuarii TaxID=2697319 RepID=UPI0013D7AD62|nr:hypothetical protein [Pseudooceanicola aestuarii]